MGRYAQASRRGVAANTLPAYWQQVQLAQPEPGVLRTDWIWNGPAATDATVSLTDLTTGTVVDTQLVPIADGSHIWELEPESGHLYVSTITADVGGSQPAIGQSQVLTY